MKIGIDARPLVGNKSGIGHYLEEILLVFAREHGEHEYYLFAHDDFAMPAAMQGMKKVVVRGRFGTFWLQYALPYLMKKHEIELFWGPNYAIPLINPTGARMVMTIHDMVSYLFAETLPARTVAHNRWGLPLYLRQTDRVITVSESSKRDIVRFLDVSPSEIDVTLLGVNQAFFPNGDDGVARLSRYGIDFPYILCVGTIEPRKNLASVIEAYARLLVEGTTEHRLVIVGAKGWKYGPVYELLQSREDLRERVIFPGYVSDEDLPAMYQGASLMVYPSLYEGFGLPPLEAMAAGTPVITSNVSSLPEVVGEAGLMVNPYSLDELTAAMRRVLLDKELACELSAAGAARARTLLWEQTARQTMWIFHDVMSGGCR